jgi:hypothetical protein
MKAYKIIPLEFNWKKKKNLKWSLTSIQEKVVTLLVFQPLAIQETVLLH